MAASEYPSLSDEKKRLEADLSGGGGSMMYPNLCGPVFSEKGSPDPTKNMDDDFLTNNYVDDGEDDDEDSVDFANTKDELFDTPRFSGVVEWFNCLLFDVILLLLETVMAIWLARSLYPYDLITEYRTILVVLAFPALINPFLWLKMKSSGTSPQFKSFSTLFIFVLLLISLNSPFFVYVWHLYQSALVSRRRALNSKILANTFRMVQAVMTSVPLMVINVATLAAVLQSDDDDTVLDINLLKSHLSEGDISDDHWPFSEDELLIVPPEMSKSHNNLNYKPSIKMHGLAFLISFINIVRAASLYNERLTFTVLFVIVSMPFILLTIISRAVSYSIIVAFLDIQWTAALFCILFISNVVLYVACRKRSQPEVQLDRKSVLRPIGAHHHPHRSSAATNSTNADIGTTPPSTSTDDDLIQPADSISETSGNCNLNCCGANGNQGDHNVSHQSGKYNVTTGKYYKTSRPKNSRLRKSAAASSTSCWLDLPSVLAHSFGSIIVPVGYSNDFRHQHPRIKGGLFLLINYIVHAVLIGLALGFTIRNRVPNTIKGLTISNPSIDVQIPDSKITIGAAGMDIALNMPRQKMNLGSMPSMSATINTDSSDLTHAIILPVLLAIFCLPFVIMRAAMMELDCFITHKKDLNSIDEEMLASKNQRRIRRETRLRGVNSENSGVTLLDTVLRNTQSHGLKARMYVSLCCGLFGMMIFTMFVMMAGAFVFMALH